MTTEELDTYKEKIINEIRIIQSEKTLNSIKRILRNADFKRKPFLASASNHVSETDCDSQNYFLMETPCCYTVEEITERVADALEAYQQGASFTNRKFSNDMVRWSENAIDESNNILRYIKLRFSELDSLKFEGYFESALGIIGFNHKAGKKERRLTHMGNGKIRSIVVNKYSKLLYVEMPDCILVLAVYCLSPMDNKQKIKKYTSYN